MNLPMLKCRQCGSEGCGIWACRLTGIKNAVPQERDGRTGQAADETSVGAAPIRLSSECYEEKLGHLTAK